MRSAFAVLLAAAVLLPSTPSSVLAQGAGSSISGVVLDSAGGAIPGATVVVASAAKRFPIAGRTNVEVRFDLLNLFDNINFDPVANPGGGATIFQTTGAYRDPTNNFDPGGRLGQISLRLNW